MSCGHGSTRPYHGHQSISGLPTSDEREENKRRRAVHWPSGAAMILMSTQWWTSKTFSHSSFLPSFLPQRHLLCERVWLTRLRHKHIRINMLHSSGSASMQTNLVNMRWPASSDGVEQRNRCMWTKHHKCMISLRIYNQKWSNRCRDKSNPSWGKPKSLSAACEYIHPRKWFHVPDNILQGTICFPLVVPKGRIKIQIIVPK